MKYARQELSQLNSAGFNMGQKRCVRLHTNPQDERLEHAHAKMACAKVCAEAGYFIDSEIEHTPTGNIADLIAYGLEDRMPIVIELESVIEDDTKRNNLAKYNHAPIQEVYTLDVDAFGTDITEMQEHAQDQLGL
jgi:hypothetical protein